MSIGFVILSFQEPDEAFIRLLGHLSKYPKARVIIHHDCHQSAFPQALIDRFSLTLFSGYRTYWSHLNNVLATIHAFRILEKEGLPDWTMTVTPSCYPAMPLERIAQDLEKTQYDTLIDMRAIDLYRPASALDRWIAKDIKNMRLAKIPFLSRHGKVYRRQLWWPRAKNTLPFDEDYLAYHGSNWLSLSKNALQALLEQNPEEHPVTKFFTSFAGHGDMFPCPQEVIIPSILGNLGLDNSIQSKRFIDWEGVTDWSPHWLDLGHFEAIAQGQYHFARKMHPKKSLALMDKIDRELL